MTADSVLWEHLCSAISSHPVCS